MTIATSALPRRQVNLAAVRLAPDRRRHKRVSLTCAGRFMRSSTKLEYSCHLRDISVGGAALLAPIELEVGERIVAYFDQLGGLEGTVARLFPGGFAVRFNATQHKREKLAAQIMWMMNRHEFSSAEDRRFERIPVANKRASLKLDDGIVVDADVIDISLSGASIGTTARPAVGAEIMFGKQRARVMRHHDRGIGVQFLETQQPEELRRFLD